MSWLKKVFSGVDRTDFGTGNIKTVIIRMAIPMTTAQLVNVLYNIVDRMYIGHIPVVGDTALTGLGVALPLATIAAAFSNFCGYGGVPLFSIARGEGDEKRASRIMGNAMLISIFFGLFLTAGFLLFKDGLLYAFGASDNTFPYANGYASVYALGTLFVSITLGMNGFISAQGFSKISMLTVVIGALINVVLDPVFIYGFGMGVKGAAVATVIAQFCSAAWILRFLTGNKALIRLNLPDMRPVFKHIWEIMTLGLTGFFVSITHSAVQILSNVTLRYYGGDLYVGVMTVINSAVEFSHISIKGLTQAAQPVIGFNYGAKKWRRVSDGIGFMTAGGALYSVILFAVFMIFPEQVIRIFNNNPDLVRVGVPAIRLNFCAFMLMFLQFSGQTVFMGIGNSKLAIFFSMFRKVVIMLPLIVLLPRIPALGIMGVFLAEPISEIFGGGTAFATMYFVIWRKVRKLAVEQETEEKYVSDI